VANLHAFARLYGVVRWFHPSDAAAVLDWDRFAVDGVHRVADAPDTRVLRTRLMELFGPVAPTMQIVSDGGMFLNVPALHPTSTTGLDVIAWQHKGYGDSTIATGYASKRLHRDRVTAQPGALFASLSQSLDATPFRGSRVRLRGKLRTGAHARGQLWLRIDRGELSGFFDNMGEHPLVSETWSSGEIIGTVASDATQIIFGALNTSPGTVWYDDLELSAESEDGSWRPIEIQDAGFEASDPFTSWHMGIGRSAPALSIDGWNVVVDHKLPASGAASLRIEPATTIITRELFGQAPAPAETLDVDLGSGLRARIPIALYAKGDRTIGDDPETARSAQTVPRPPSISGFDPLTGAADVIVFWNVLEHFWPYWNTVPGSWSKALDVALADSADDHSVADHVTTLERLSAGSPDGHIIFDCPGAGQRAYPPFAVDLVESQVVVTTSSDSAIERGDVILSVNGRPATEQLAMEEAHLSGSQQWRMVSALQRFDTGPVDSVTNLRLRRDDHELNATVPRVRESVVDTPLHSPIEPFDDGTYYVDLSRATMAEIDAVITRLAAAPGVVFDLRGYPRHNHQVLSYMMTRPDDLKGWESIPLIIRPDSASMPAGWEDTSTWNMPRLSVRQPHIRGRIAFMTGPGAISSAETFMALVAYYHLGEIVGSATAGTNGDIAQITLPTSCVTWFTGRRVTNPAGGQHHLIGVQPTIPASRSISGIRAGRDEVLEKALSYVRSGSKPAPKNARVPSQP
jgi:Peptidase family S41